MYVTLIAALLLGSCNSKPKVVEATDDGGGPSMESLLGEDKKQEVHSILVKEAFDASRYTLINGTEGDEDRWIAIPQTDVEIGKTYYYRGGIRMHDFESKELNRVFPTLYLVNGLSMEPTPTSSTMAQGHIDMHGGEPEKFELRNVEPLEGGVSLQEVLGDPAAFANQTVKVRGQCVKVNRNIMGKNWIHLQDGSKDNDGNPFDLTASTQENIVLGSVITIEGIIGVDKDFGAGYHYPVILEEAIIK